jgi:hypothetical protein
MQLLKGIEGAQGSCWLGLSVAGNQQCSVGYHLIGHQVHGIDGAEKGPKHKRAFKKQKHFEARDNS